MSVVGPPSVRRLSALRRTSYLYQMSVHPLSDVCPHSIRRTSTFCQMYVYPLPDITPPSVGLCVRPTSARRTSTHCKMYNHHLSDIHPPSVRRMSNICQMYFHPLSEKSHIRETKNLSACAVSSTTVGWTENIQKPEIFKKRKKSLNMRKLKNV